LLVDEVAGRPATPRWLGSTGPLSAELARRLYLLRVQAAEAIRDGRAVLARLLAHDYGLSEPAVRALAELFECQEQVSEIPEPGVCLVEVVANDLGTDCYLHTPLNRAANEALAWLALRRLTRQGRTAQALPADLGLALSLRGAALSGDDLAALFAPASFDDDLAQALEDSVALRERFRGTATVGLMLLRQPLGGRRRVGGRDWAERRLFDRVRALDADFVLLRQTRRELLAERLDAAAAREYALTLPQQAVRVRRLAGPSPLAESWTQLGVAAEHPSTEEALTRLHAELMGS
jgi:ATP-dependent Lhr-like helicase